MDDNPKIEKLDVEEFEKESQILLDFIFDKISIEEAYEEANEVYTMDELKEMHEKYSYFFKYGTFKDASDVHICDLCEVKK